MEDESIVYANNALGFDILKELSKAESDKNVFISPLSITIAMTMASCGATEGTPAHDALRKVLHQDRVEEDKIKKHFHKFLSALEDETEGVQCVVAQSAWTKEAARTRVKPEYKEMASTNFHADVLPLTNADAVNKWCAEKTHNMIPQIINTIPQEAMLILLNAVYFKGTWAVSFDKEKTTEEDFSTSRDQMRVQMMQQQRKDFHYFEREGHMQMIELDYGQKDNSKYCATVILPHSSVSCSDLLEKMNVDDWNTWRASLKKREGTLFVPRINVRYGVQSLKEPFLSLGMEAAFASSDAYGRIGPNVSLSDVLHMAVLELDEEGTTASAATAAVMMRAMVIEKPHAKFEMRVNRPFLLCISEKESGNLLFVGKIERPS